MRVLFIPYGLLAMAIKQTQEAHKTEAPPNNCFGIDISGISFGSSEMLRHAPRPSASGKTFAIIESSNFNYFNSIRFGIN